MKHWAFTTCLLFILGSCNAALADSGLESRALGLSDIPACGIKCVVQSAPASGCSLTDVECVCHNDELELTLSACMLANCTMSDTLRSVKVQSNLCGFSQASKQTEMLMYTGIIYPLGFLLIALRIAGKIVSKRLSMDDWLVVAALLLLALPAGCVLEMSKIGFGKHLWNLEDGDLLRILRLFWVAQSFYVLVLAMIKVSLVFFYLEIFITRQFRVAAYIVLTYIVVNSLVIFILGIFSCIPVSGFWNRDIKAKCVDFQALAYANSGSAILQDLILLILPMAFISNLQMGLYRKIAVAFMFAFGTFGCVATIIRLRTLLSFRMSLDPTWDYVPVTIWTELELGAGFVCVSMSPIRMLIMKAIPVSAREFLQSLRSRSRSRSRSKSSSKPSQPREWKKPSSWMTLSHDAKDSGHGSSNGTNIDSLWSQYSLAPADHHHLHSNSHRLDSASSNYFEHKIPVTRPSFNEKRLDSRHDQIELLRIPKSPRTARQSIKSEASRDSCITALPSMTRIGVLPEGSFSDDDVREKTSKGFGRKWSGENHR